MLGAIYGDIYGCSLKGKNTEARGFSGITLLTLAVAQWLTDDERHTREGLEQCIQMMDDPENPKEKTGTDISGIPAAACVSPVGLYACTEEEAKRLARIVAETMGDSNTWVAATVALCVFINRNEGTGGIAKTRELMQWLMKTIAMQPKEETATKTTDECLQAATTAYQTWSTLKECARYAARAGGNAAAAIACSILAADDDVRDGEPTNQLLKKLPINLRTIMASFENDVFPSTPTLQCFKVVADKIYAGEYPIMKDDDEETVGMKMRRFKHFGITHFIDLTEEGELRPYKEMLHDGMTHMRFPVKKQPAFDSAKDIWYIIRMIDRILETTPDAKVYLHCSDGIGRTGMVVGCLIAEKTEDSFESTLKRLRKLFDDCPKALFSMIPNTEEQVMFIQKYIFWKHVRPTKYKQDEKQQAIDLGLPSGTKWASCNRGASRPEEYGDYFSWDELPEAIPHHWDNGWNIPSYDEIKELVENCRHEWTTSNGTNGMRFTGPNGNSIFLPAAGDRYDKTSYQGCRGYYWSSSLTSNDENMAYALFFFTGESYPVNCYRDRRHPVRLVKK